MENKFCLLKIVEKILFIFVVLSLSILITLGGYLVVQKKYIYPIKHKEEVFTFSDLYELKRELVFATIKVESGFNKDAKSNKGALGLMQISPSTAEFIASELGIINYDLSEPKTNINFGCFYLRYLINKFGSEKTAIVAFNAGEGNVSSWLNDKDKSKDGKNLDYIPFKESRNYSIKIQKSLSKYRKLYGKMLDKQ